MNNPDPHIRVVELIVMGSLLRVWEGEVLGSNSAIEISQFMITNIFDGIERTVITHLDFLLPNSGYLPLLIYFNGKFIIMLYELSELE